VLITDERLEEEHVKGKVLLLLDLLAISKKSRRRYM